MGLMERLGFVRKDSIQRDWTTGVISGKNEPSTFKASLLLNRATDKNNLEHLYMVAREDPIARFMVYKLAENALDDGFKFMKNGKEVLLECQKELIRLNAKHVLTQALAAERWAGWSWVHVIKNINTRPEGNTTKIAKLDFFNPIDCKVWKYNDAGQPSKLRVKKFKFKEGLITDKVEWVPLDASNFIPVRTRPYDRSYQGDPVIYSVFDDLVAIRETIGSMTFYDSKIGNGLFGIYLNASPDETIQGKMQVEVEKFCVQRAVAVDPEIIDKIEFIGANAGATDFEGHVRILLERVSAGISIPVDILIGATAGAITGSETNIKALFQAINSIQQGFEPTIRSLTEMLGYGSDYDIVWNVRFAHDEEQQARIRITDSQTNVQNLQLMTVNEVRETIGLPSLEGGDVCLSIKEESPSRFEFEAKGFPTPEEEDQTRNEEGTSL